MIFCKSRLYRGARGRLFVLGVVVALSLAVPGTASAQTAKPAWQLTDVATPTVLLPETTQAEYHVVAENVGGAATEGGFTVHVSIPSRFKVIFTRIEPGGECVEDAPGSLECTSAESIVPSGFVAIAVELEVTAGSGSIDSVASIAGGGAVATAGDTARMSVGDTRGPAGVALFRSTATGAAGEPVTQAGAHPNLLTTTVLFNNVFVPTGSESEENLRPVSPVKDLVFYLPMGMLGNTTITTPCAPLSVETTPEQTGCPASSRVGSILPMVVNNVLADRSDPTHVSPIYSVRPEKGYVAEFAFASNNILFFIYANVVMHDGVYVLRVATPGVPQVAQLVGLVASFYGDVRANGTDYGAFLTDPGDCESDPRTLTSSVEVNTWQDPERLESVGARTFPAVEGCGLLPFSSTLSAGPDIGSSGDTGAADEPSGYSLDLGVPQAPNDFVDLATPPFRTVNFTFPAGTSLSPGAANGLTACKETGPEGIDFPDGRGTPGAPGTVTGEGEEDGPDGLPHPVKGNCPASSIVGTVRAETPLLSQPLTGHLYLAEPGCGNAAHPNACVNSDAADGTLYRLFLELEAPDRGVIIKLPGTVHVNPDTGQITSSFQDNPQFPVSDLRIETNGGPRASLANPQACGTATTSGYVAPWSGGPASEPSGSFQVQGCEPQRFAPSFTAGTVSPLAGAYSPFTLTLKREDREQDIGALSTTLPPGLLASIAHTTRCPEPQAAQGDCPSSSRVGSAHVAIGAGSEPYWQTGQVYFTGPYAGAPFGLSVVVPAVAGPFNLGDVVVRAAVSVDPHTGQVTTTTPTSGPGALPRMIDGVPLRIRTINTTLDNPAFTFNPTNCGQLHVTGTVTSTQGTQTALSSPFAAQGCSNLPFKPVFKVSTRGFTSRRNGASLDVKVTSGAGQANIGKVHVSLPKALPSRDSTLKLACLASVFAANPAACPAGSNVGSAVARTPILASPLSGPAYLVSHGGAGFPDLEIVLQGEGVTLILDGHTNIKNGITSSSFNTIPDAPITSFELKLPEGPHSALAAPGGRLCQTSLTMPTSITAQNNTTVKQTTKVTITGCTKHKTRNTNHRHRKH